MNAATPITRRKQIGDVLAYGLLLCGAGCGRAPGASTKEGARPHKKRPKEMLTVAVTAAEHAELLEFVRPLLVPTGVALGIASVPDSEEACRRLSEHQVDAICFETRAFTEEYNRVHGGHLVSLTAVDIEPYAVFSRKHSSWSGLSGGEVVAIPRDPLGRGRALLQLRRLDVLHLKEPAPTRAIQADITENWLRLQIREMDVNRLPAALDDADFVIMSLKDAKIAGLDSNQDVLNIENSFSRFTNFLIAREDNIQNAGLQSLATVLREPDVAAFIARAFQGLLRPAL